MTTPAGGPSDFTARKGKLDERPHRRWPRSARTGTRSHRGARVGRCGYEAIRRCRPARARGGNPAGTPGEAVAVMGPSGSEKSTLLNLLAGLDKPTSGTITVAGQRVDSLSETGVARSRRQHIGMIFQFFNLLDDLTVADNVLLPAQLAGVRRAKARARTRDLLERLDTERYANTYPGRLSGGERQRVAIARALVNSPTLLLADEPTGALDTSNGEAIGQTLILVTHSHDLPARYARRTIGFTDGQIVTDTTGRPGVPSATRHDRRPGAQGGGRRADPPPGPDPGDRHGAGGRD
ncbi:MAG: ABC transporter ATP-binding protein [Streptosporangiaceae bacterium]